MILLKQWIKNPNLKSKQILFRCELAALWRETKDHHESHAELTADQLKRRD